MVTYDKDLMQHIAYQENDEYRAEIKKPEGGLKNDELLELMDKHKQKGVIVNLSKNHWCVLTKVTDKLDIEIYDPYVGKRTLNPMEHIENVLVSKGVYDKLKRKVDMTEIDNGGVSEGDNIDSCLYELGQLDYTFKLGNLPGIQKSDDDENCGTLCLYILKSGKVKMKED